MPFGIQVDTILHRVVHGAPSSRGLAGSLNPGAAAGENSAPGSAAAWGPVWLVRCVA